MYSILFMDYKNSMHCKAARERIALAASTLVCYDIGYRKVMGETMITRWIHELEQSARVQGHRIGLKSKHKGMIGGTYISRINERDLTYLTYLFHYASGILGHTATFQQLANAINVKAATEDVFPNMHLLRDKLKRWFRDMKGKEL
jgi:hypothetical protein